VLQLTMAGEYTVRAMLHLASQPRGAVVQIYDIAQQCDIPETFLRKIIQLLTKSSLVLSHRGVGGGIELAKSAEDITLLEVIEAAEGKLALNKCLIQAGFCPRDSWCAVHLVWGEVQDKMKEILRSKSIAELARQSLQRRQQICLAPQQLTPIERWSAVPVPTDKILVPWREPQAKSTVQVED
jgi:Rrf2 family protein